jgi:hypothetical protein
MPHAFAQYSGGSGDGHSFDEFIAADPLPIILVDFTAISTENGVEISWTTASEINNDFFLLERSFDGITWVAIAKIKGCGTSSYMQEYEFFDTHSKYLTHYYRLKQTDYDGKYTYSNIISATIYFQENSIFTIFYDSLRESIIIDCADSTQQDIKIIEVLSLQGNVLFKTQSYSRKINTRSFMPGMYYVYIEFSHSFITQKILLK